MRAYYADKLSENISETPEQYLICRNVPIARTGPQEYLGEEMGLEEFEGQMLEALREESEVFSPAALASFEGKPVVDEHPSEDVYLDNANRLMKGIATNIRRGSGEDHDKVLADLIIYDPIMKNKILTGKRAISCGYDCVYEVGADGVIRQKEIRGNHVAVVTAGRAGKEVVIHDHAPDPPPQNNPPTERRRKFMSKPASKRKDGLAALIGRVFPMFAADADPEAVAEVVEAIVEIAGDSETPNDNAPGVDTQPAAPADNEAADNAAEPPVWAKQIFDELSAIKDQMAQGQADNDPLSQLEAELLGGEESVTIPVEEMGLDEGAEDEGAEDNEAEDTFTAGDSEAEDEGAEDDGTTDEDPVGTLSVGDSMSRKQVLALIRQVKPAIAKIQDTKQRKRVSDSFAKMARLSLGVRGRPQNQGAYAAIINTRQQSAKNRIKDSAPKMMDPQKLGMELAKKHNPHYREK